MTRSLRWVYAGWFVLVSAMIFLQLYLAGYGVFAFAGLPPFDAHRAVGDLIGIAILIGVGLAFAARAPWRMTGVNGALVVLMAVQFLLAFAGAQAIAALHVVNGVLILLGTLYQAWTAIRLAQSEKSQPRVQMEPAVTR